AREELGKTSEQVVSGENGDQEMRLVRNAKRIALFTLGTAHEKCGADLEKQQEIVMSLSDLFLETFAMESTWLRSRKLATAGKAAAGEISAIFLRDAMARMQASAQNILSACCKGRELEQSMAKLRSYAEYEPVNAIAMRRNIAARLLDAERYPF